MVILGTDYKKFHFIDHIEYFNFYSGHYNFLIRKTFFPEIVKIFKLWKIYTVENIHTIKICYLNPFKVYDSVVLGTFTLSLSQSLELVSFAKLKLCTP